MNPNPPPADERELALARITAQARRAHEAEPDLLPAVWARVRTKVDRAPARARRSLLPWLGLALGVAAAVAVALVVALRPPTPASSEPAPMLAARGLATPSRAELPAPPELARPMTAKAVEDGEHPIDVKAGDRLEGGVAGRTITAFGRHTLVLESSSALTVTHWEANRMELALERGVASFEVNRATPDETFVVWSGDVAVHVRGTIFTVERTPTGTTRVTVDRGHVVVSRAGGDDVPVSMGERVTFPPLQAAALDDDAAPPTPATPGHPAAPPRAKRPAPKPEKVIDIDVGMDRAPDADRGEAPDVSAVLPALLSTVRAGRCVQALNALAELERGLGRDTPRAALWLTAYCKRKLGDQSGSAALFQRYGAAGPWAVPTGDELPPLP
ncbi:MAG: FecR family protein [Myxococcota bacterium]